MSDYPDRTTKAEREARRERAQLVTAGFRGSDYLTPGERALLDRLRAASYAISRGVDVGSAPAQRQPIIAARTRRIA